MHRPEKERWTALQAERRSGPATKKLATLSLLSALAILMGYVESVIHNDTTILFLRKANDFNTPFITMEIFEGRLMQAYHRFNRDCTETEAQWIREYCERHGIDSEGFQFDRELDLLF